MPSAFAHYCHARGCKHRVPPSMFMCKAHWFALPASYRSSIWSTYVVGQEVTKTPSELYLKAADQAIEFITLLERASGKVRGT